MPKAFVNGLTINYEQTGSGPHLALIHGLTGSLAFWNVWVVPALADMFTVLTFDLRGHGDSDMPPSGYTSAEMASDLVTLLDDRGIDQAHVAGHSFGGTIALHLAAQHPDRVAALTISDSRIWMLQPIQKVKDWPHWGIWKAQLRQHGLSVDEESELDFSLLEPLMLQRPPQSQQTPPIAARGRGERWKTLLASTTAKYDLKDPAGLTTEMIGQLRPPTQAIYGELSFCLPTLDGLRKLLPSLKSTILPGVGHLFPITRPALFIEHLKAFHMALNLTPNELLRAERMQSKKIPKP
jgi:pimeloyl-ACP methyl ester carboxylesterase